MVLSGQQQQLLNHKYSIRASTWRLPSDPWRMPCPKSQTRYIPVLTYIYVYIYLCLHRQVDDDRAPSGSSRLLAANAMQDMRTRAARARHESCYESRDIHTHCRALRVLGLPLIYCCSSSSERAYASLMTCVAHALD